MIVERILRMHNGHFVYFILMIMFIYNIIILLYNNNYVNISVISCAFQCMQLRVNLVKYTLLCI